MPPLAKPVTKPHRIGRLRWHELKCDCDPFAAVWTGAKTAELRDLSDRDIQVGDTLLLEEYDRARHYYSGRSVRVKVTHMQRGYGLPANMAMLSFRITRRYFGNNRFTVESTLKAAQA